MYICLCQAITDAEILAAAEAGASEVQDLMEALGVGANCGACVEAAQAIINAEPAGSLAYAA